MGPTLRYILQLLVLVPLVIGKRYANFPCPRQCMCGPSIEGDLNILCTENRTTILHVDVFFKRYLQVDCSIGSTNYTLLDGLLVGPVQLVRFKFCPLSDELISLSRKLNITGVQKFELGYISSQINIEKQHLKNYANITKLSLTHSETTSFPNDLLNYVPSLTSLNLQGNKLETIPNGFFNAVTNLTFIELGDNNISRLDSNTFDKLSQLKYLNLWGNSLQNLSRTVFSGVKNLESLDLHSSQIQVLAPEIFTDLVNLKELSLFKNNFSNLPEGLFNNNRHLKTIKLFDNYQRLTLPSGLLSNLSNLTGVYLQGNNMSTIPGDLLKGSPAITLIRLENNALTELPMDLFANSVELQQLDISYNLLTSLPDELFASLSKLKILKLSNNQLTTIQQSVFKELVKLEELDLARNRLVYIHPKAFPTGSNCHIKKLYLAHNHMTMKQDSSSFIESQSVLNSCLSFKELYLANNSITEIFTDWRQVMLSLEKLDLGNNNISLIKTDDLHFLSNKLKINLSNNQINYVNMQNIERLVKLFQPAGSNQPVRDVQVILNGNPIRCDCHAYTLLQYVEGMFSKNVYDFVHLTTDKVMCSSPPEVLGASLSQLKSSKVTCDLTDVKSINCPKPCTCRSRTDDSAFIVDCAGLGLLQAPEHVPNTSNLSKHYEVHLQKNRLVSLPELTQPGYDKVTTIFASHNNISRLAQQNLSPNLQVLELNGNNLTYIPTSVIDVLQRNSTRLEHLRIDNNPLKCDCETRELLNYLQVHFQQVAFLSNVSCSDGRVISQLSASELCPVSNAWIIALSTCIAIIGIALGTFAALYYRYQHEVKVWLYAKQLCLWFVTEEELDKDKQYDAFISFSHNDEDFVVNHLVPGLESGPKPFKLCLHFRDWIPGEWITSQITRSVENSRRTVVVLSPNFLESVWGRMEFRAAHKQALSDGRARVILLIYGELGPIDSMDTELRTYLSTNTYVKWGDPWFWRKLRYALPHPTLPKEPISTPPKSHTNAAFDDKFELMHPVTPTPTTPPADSIINPMTRANEVTPFPLLNGLNTKLIIETNNLVNGCVKSV